MEISSIAPILELAVSATERKQQDIMLIYDRLTYNIILKNCSTNQYRQFIESNMLRIEQFAIDNQIEISDCVKQIMLHMPQFDVSNIHETNFFNNLIMPILKIRFTNFSKNMNTYHDNCGFELLSKEHLKIKSENIVDCKFENTICSMEVKEMEESDASFIENNLHYLRSYRKDSVFRIGLFIKNYRYPICYMSFCDVDRKDKLDAINLSLAPSNTNNSKVIELSRVFGCGRLPQNTISYLVSYGNKQLRFKGYDYLITAVNPFLGFNGISMIASGFSPFAIRPVKYFYSEDTNEYLTFRNCKKEMKTNSKIPSNILYIKSIKNITKPIKIKMVQITESEVVYFKTDLEDELFKVRRLLESTWDTKTRYQAVTYNKNDRHSKGQCGVSSIYLAKKLTTIGYSVKFCVGNVYFPNEENSIFNHCWLKLELNNLNTTEIVIDITADQNGHKERIIFNDMSDLESNNIIYESLSENKIDEIVDDDLFARLAYLERALSKYKRNINNI